MHVQAGGPCPGSGIPFQEAQIYLAVNLPLSAPLPCQSAQMLEVEGAEAAACQGMVGGLLRKPLVICIVICQAVASVLTPCSAEHNR